MLTCDCGYTMTPSGNHKDRATCFTCWWTASGPGAEHEGTHHHLATGHRWHLSVYEPE